MSLSVKGWINASLYGLSLILSIFLYKRIILYVGTLHSVLLILYRLLVVVKQEGDNFRNTSRMIGLLFALVFILSVLNYLAPLNILDDFFGRSEVFKDTLSGETSEVEIFFHVFYYTCVTFVTLGYGDLSPASVYMQIIAILVSFTGYIVFGIIVSRIFKYIMKD